MFPPPHPLAAATRAPARRSRAVSDGGAKAGEPCPNQFTCGCFSCGQLHPSLLLLAHLEALWGLGCPVPMHCFVDEEKAKQDPSYYLKNTNTETRETLQELYKEFKGDEILAATMKPPEKKKVDQLNAVSGALWFCL